MCSKSNIKAMVPPIARRILSNSRRGLNISGRCVAKRQQSTHFQQQGSQRYSFRKVVDKINPYTEVLSISAGAVVVCGGILFSFANKVQQVEKEIETVKTQANAKIETVKTQANAKIETVKTQGNAEIKIVKAAAENAKKEAKDQIKIVETQANAEIKIVKAEAEIAKKEAKDQIKIVETQANAKIAKAEAQIAIVKAEAKKEVAAAERRVAEKFLMYGYAAEYARYQELDRIKKEEVEKP
jgi:hypothetical protein